MISRNSKIVISSDNVAVKTEISLPERARVLIEEIGLSDRVVSAIPPDEEQAP